MGILIALIVMAAGGAGVYALTKTAPKAAVPDATGEGAALEPNTTTGGVIDRDEMLDEPHYLVNDYTQAEFLALDPKDQQSILQYNMLFQDLNKINPLAAASVGQRVATELASFNRMQQSSLSTAAFQKAVIDREAERTANLQASGAASGIAAASQTAKSSTTAPTVATKAPRVATAADSDITGGFTGGFSF